MHNLKAPKVSVVIPTRNRSSLVLRAVRSALAQTLSELEVVVIVDGPDAMTVSTLQSISDSRLLVYELPSSVGGSDARNIGARRASGEFIAFLDDDDEWMPEKLVKQLAVATASDARLAVVTNRLIARRQDSDEIWPRRAPEPGEPMSEYLLCRPNSIRQGEGFIQTSTLLVPRALMLEAPFLSGLPRHQDWDWIIRVSARPGVRFEWVWEPLTIYHIDGNRKTVSSGNHCEPSLRWVDESALITTKARAYFYATQIAVRCNSYALFRAVVTNTIRHPRAFAIAMGLIFTPKFLVHKRPQATGVLIRHA